MKYIIDTHALIWYAEGSLKLSEEAKNIIENKHNDLLLSLASVWEMAIKSQLGKLNFLPNFKSFIESEIQLVGYKVLPIQLEHVHIVESLPLFHRDPFDRIIIAQAVNDDVSVLSADITFDKYTIKRIW